MADECCTRLQREWVTKEPNRRVQRHVMASTFAKASRTANLRPRPGTSPRGGSCSSRRPKMLEARCADNYVIKAYS
jgi:hypothetical protein